MKTFKFLQMLVLAIFIMSCAQSQLKIDDSLFSRLPDNLELNDEVQTYLMITDHHNGDIFGNFHSKMRLKGEYTRGLAGGAVKWNNVTVAFSMHPDEAYTDEQTIDYMENFTYVTSRDMLNPEKFQTFTDHSAFTKNLIWDMMGIEGLAWLCFDKLELNKPYKAVEFNQKMELAGQGFFENRNMVLTWTGISKQNNELCAVIEYRTLNNPLEVVADGLEIKGLSNYWGNIWVSLEDKQIEYATLFENVTMELLLPGQTNKQLANTIREIEVIKLQTTR